MSELTGAESLTSSTVSLEHLERATAALAEAATPPEVFRLLLEGSRLGTPRATILLVRRDALKGWGSAGYPAESAGRLRGLSLAVADSWLARVVDDETLVTDSLRPGEPAVDFGQTTAAETLAVPVRVVKRIVALLVAERSPGQSPWSPAALRLLADVAQIRLELDLAHRKIKSAREATGTPVAEAPAAPAATPEPAATAPAVAPAPAEPAELAPAEEATDADDGSLEPARRYARLIATDIRLYNEEAVMLGRRNGDLAERLGEHLRRGRETFLRRFPELGSTGMRVLHDAFVQVLAAGDAGLLPAGDGE